MAKGRMISSDIWGNRKFASLKKRQQLLAIGLMTNADDQGRLRGHPTFIRSVVFPYSNISPRTMGNDLSRIAENGTIKCYEVEDESYIQILNWWQHQRANWAAPSVLPAPPFWKDHINYRYGGRVLTHNWGSKEDTCNAQGIPYSMPIQYPTEEPLDSYREGKGSEVKRSEGKGGQDAEYQRNPEKPEAAYTEGKYGGYIKS